MGSATSLDSHPAPVALLMLAAVEPELLELVDQWYENLQKATFAGGGISMAGQAKLPSFTGGWRHLPLISRRKPGECRRRHPWDHGQVQHNKVSLSIAAIQPYAVISLGRKVEKSKSPGFRQLGSHPALPVLHTPVKSRRIPAMNYNTNNRLHWGILGAGNIAKAFARGVQHSATGELVAVGSRDQAKADKFGGELNIPTRHGSYEALLADPNVQAVYIALPHPFHTVWAIRAAEAKKHLLVEKPIAINHAEAMAIVEAAIANDVFLMEAYMYRCHPQTHKLVELIKSKAIGDVRVIQATFSFHAGFNAEGRLFSNALAGGGILDVGGYCTSMARLIAGAATDKDFAEPTEVKACGVLNDVTKTDDYAVASLKFPGNIIAELATGVACNQENVVRIFGTSGNILVRDPWVPSREGGSTKIIVNKNGQKEPQEIVIEESRWIYGIEADTVAANLERRQAPSPAMSWADTLGNAKLEDAWRQQIGLVYEQEKQANVQTVHHRPLAVSPANHMKYGEIAGVGKPVSRLVIGVDNNTTAPHVTMMFDNFFERGGNVFDTAHIYGGGASERALGGWINHRKVRKQVVILDKGAHTPNCNPEDLSKQFAESLDRLKVDYVDIYMMHRDNLDIPVGEFVDVLHEHVAAGRMHAIGGSNWSLKRVADFNKCAKRKGKTPFSAVSNNFSLARMVEAVWSGCILASDAESRKWFKKTQMPLMGWSSQARGFFLPGNAHPDKKTDPELVRCWYSEDNFKRLERVNEMAAQRNVLPINIALAYVLCQPFPTFALIGPRQLSETRTSFQALDVQLTPEELKWLNLED